MSIEGYREYQKREFCKDVACPVQKRLNSMEEGSEEYESVREECMKACKHTTREFHYWLIEKGFIILKPDKGGA